MILKPDDLPMSASPAQTKQEKRASMVRSILLPPLSLLVFSIAVSPAICLLILVIRWALEVQL